MKCLVTQHYNCTNKHPQLRKILQNANISIESIKYIQLYFIIQRQQKKKATNKQTRTKDKFSQLKSFSSHLAKPETGPQIKVN